MKTYLEEWYEKNLSDIDDKIETSRYCNDVSFGEYRDESKTYFYFGGYKRVWLEYQPSLKCPNPTEEDGSLKLYGGMYKLKIGLLNIDEISYSGGIYANTNYFLYILSDMWWTMSPYNMPDLYIAEYDTLKPGSVLATNVSYYHYAAGHVRPVINLKPDVKMTGEGTKGNPFSLN